ncbi:MAG: multiheme c-type cytochrome, partial [Lysobacterales bacterium]
MTTEKHRRIHPLLAAAVIFLAGAWMAVAPIDVLAQDAANAPDPDAKCVKCHSRGLKKKLEDGEVLSLKVDVDAFDSSVHTVIGCTGCHRDVAKGKHPSRQPIENHRVYSQKQNESCRQCHRAKYEAYDGSVHANLVRAGSDKAPLCSDCHSAHAIQRHETYDRDSGKPCSKCHTDIFTAYEESVHGTARSQGNRFRADHFKAPVCADCHSAHDISAVASTGYLVSTCMSCHEVAKLAHEKWLPNAPMHMQSVGCSACHAPDAGLRVDLQLWDQVNQQAVGAENRYAPLRETLAEIGNEEGGMSSLDLWKLMRLTKAGAEDFDLTLRGRLEVA